ncbi:hypothetical protein K488DRAFT_86867 [Vararia minispora EC-137]|uniref:Uncharacterized protein n=1 Tax=Vararia minispora EC-137 TaxID=1314806 RepID=A0ACB8QHQ8_9AGAM|nr:hypothetical protein K488DRAFT_86867 [Vararia minispora EC-137]
MADSDIVLLYDSPGNCAEDKLWSPNAWKIRFILNYKRIPYKTVWIELCDIEKVCKEVGAPPLEGVWPRYGIPFLYDPVTKSWHSNSLDIAVHLDAAYPQMPAFFPLGTEALIRGWEALWLPTAFSAIVPLGVFRTYQQLNPITQPYFRRTREGALGRPLEEIEGTPEQQPAKWEALKEALGRFDAYMTEKGPFVAGERITYADVLMAGWLVWIKRLWGPNSKEWKEVEGWHGGRWGRFMAEFSKYEHAEDKVVLKVPVP